MERVLPVTVNLTVDRMLERSVTLLGRATDRGPTGFEAGPAGGEPCR